MHSDCPNSGSIYEYASEDNYFNAYLTKDPDYIKEIPTELSNCMAKERYHDLQVKEPTKLTDADKGHVEQGNLWYYQDRSYEVPEYSVFAGFNSAKTFSTKNAGLSTIMSLELNKWIQEDLSDAFLLNRNFLGMGVGPQGFELTLTGFNLSADKMLDEVLRKLKTPGLSEENFARIQTNLVLMLNDS